MVFYIPHLGKSLEELQEILWEVIMGYYASHLKDYRKSCGKLLWDIMQVI